MDGSRVEDGGPSILVMARDAYRKLYGCHPTRSYAAVDVVSGKYLRNEEALEAAEELEG